MVGSSAAAKQTNNDGGHGPSQHERLGGARADFVANLGKRRTELRATLDALRAEPASRKHRDELRRRVHALAAGAKLLRFERLGDELKAAEARLEAASERGSLSDDDFGKVHDLIGRLTTLAWGQSEPVEGAPASKAPASSPAPVTQRAPVSALVIGGPHLAEALSLPSGTGAEDGHAFEVERSDQVLVGADLARAVAPDVIVLDGDLQGSRDLVEALASDSMLESIPVIVCLKVQRTDDAAPFMALGVARTLPKPVSPGELRRACAEAVSTYVHREISREPLGDVSLDQLGARLAEELRRGLCDVVEGSGRQQLVSLDQGTEVLAALWGAVARIRDVVTIRSQGAIRFAHGGPEGAVPLAPWMAEGVPALTQRNGRVRAASDVSLQGARVVVADDDPAVCWFLAGVLKTAGAQVYEARDGERAFEIAKHCDPDLVVTDVLMPRLDGFALCRLIKRDVVLRDVPVVLLSWKEDLLQRVRELGADADGYLRKEASAGIVVQRVKELLARRRRVSERVASEGEVRGRLDGLTAFTLVRLACAQRPECTVSVRDATYLYEIEIRGGRPVRATRTAMGGVFERGPSVLAALVGVGDGRFVIAPAREDADVAPVRAELAGSLGDQLLPVIASARAAQRLLTGPSLLGVQRVGIDQDLLAGYLAATPEPARGFLRRIAQGTSPRALITSGQISARLLEDVLSDTAVHGAVVHVFDGEGEDRLPAATALEMALLRGERAARPIVSLPVLAVPQLTPMPAPTVEVAMPTPSSFLKAALAPAPSAPAPSVVEQAWSDAVHVDVDAPPAEEAFEASPFLAAQAESAAFEPSPEAIAAVFEEPQRDAISLGTLDAPIELLPAQRAEAPQGRAKQEAARELTPTPSSLPPPPGTKSMLTLGSLHPPPVQAEAKAAPPPKNTRKTPVPAPAEAKRSDELTPLSALARRLPLPSAYMPTPQAPKRDHKALYWVLFALVGVGFAVWARWSREKTVRSETDMMQSVQVAGAAPEAAADGAPAELTPATDEAAAATNAPTEPARPADDAAPEDLPLRDGQKLKKGHGLLEVVSAKTDTIYLDGKPIGSGPLVSTPLKVRKEPYEVRVKTRDEERTRFVSVKDQRLTRVRVNPPWQR